MYISRREWYSKGESRGVALLWIAECIVRGGESKMESLGRRRGRLRIPTAAASEVVTERG